jgi:uncharacterized phage protein gp47/JayE
VPGQIRFLTYPEVLANMFAHAQAPVASGGLGPDVDLNPGSLFRTTLECAALSDADQHVQMSRIPNLFSLDKCRGDDLDQRAVEIGAEILTDLKRLPANTSAASVVVGNGTFLKTTTVATDVANGAASFVVVDGSAFPTSGAVTVNAGAPNEEDLIFTRSGNTFTVALSGSGSVLQRSHASGEPVTGVSIRSTLAAGVSAGATSLSLLAGTGAAWLASGTVILDRSATTQEKIAFTRTGDVLALGSATTFAHAAGSVVIQGTDGTDHAIPVGAQAYVPPTLSSPQINFVVQTPGGTLFDGDFVSGLIPTQSVLAGASTRVGSNQITKWTTPPFVGTTVTNPASATRGSDREEDDDYRQRIKDTVQSFSGGGTPLAIATKVKGLEDPETGAQVAFVQLVEPVLPSDRCLLYITDGTSAFSLSQRPFLGRDVVISDAVVGDARGRLGTYGPPYSYSTSAPVSPRLFSSAGTVRGTSTSTGTNFLEDTTQAMTVNAFAGMWLKTVDDVFRQVASNTAIRFVLTSGDTPTGGSYSVYNLSGSPLVPGTDFNFNPSNGDLELAVALSTHDGLVAASDGASPSLGAYLYASGLAAHVQRSVNGDPADFNAFPGFRVGGQQVLVVVPTTISQAFVVAVTPSTGFTLEQLASPVSVALQTFVNARGMGARIRISDLIVAVKAVPGVGDVSFLSPPSNLSVPAGTLLRITDADVALV